MEKLFRGPLPLLGILIIALILRFVGIQWGLPNALHINTYHPDELDVVNWALGMDSLNGKLLPGVYNYGSLQLYLINFSCTIAYLFNFVDLAHLWQGYVTANWDKLYLIARSLTVLMGTGTVWATAAIGTRLWNKRVGLIAALLLAVAPLHVLQSHWATVDVPATLWGTLAVLGAVWSLEPGRRLKGCILSGVFAGLAAATKYNMLLFILPMMAASLLSAWKGASYFRAPDAGAQDSKDAPAGNPWASASLAVAAGVASCILAFLLACPGFLLQHPRFMADLNMEALHVSRQPGETFEQTGNGFVYEWANTLQGALGLPVLLIVTGGILYAIWRRDRRSMIIGAAALPYAILIGLAEVRYARYAMPLLPLLLLWAALLITRALSVAKKDTAVFAASWRGIKIYGLSRSFLGFSFLAFVYAVGYTLWLIVPMTETDPRDRAAQWLNAHTAPTTEVAFPTMPWFQTAPVCSYLPSHRGDWQRNPAWRAQCSNVLYTTDWDVDLLSEAKPGAVVVSGFDTMDALRLGNPRAEAYLQALSDQYRIDFHAGEYFAPPGMCLDHLPYDMNYANPQILVYIRR